MQLNALRQVAKLSASKFLTFTEWIYQRNAKISHILFLFTLLSLKIIAYAIIIS